LVQPVTYVHHTFPFTNTHQALDCKPNETRLDRDIELADMVVPLDTFGGLWLFRFFFFTFFIIVIFVFILTFFLLEFHFTGHINFEAHISLAFSEC